MSDPNPDGSPALAAAVKAILNRRLAASKWHNADDAAHRAAILLDALPDAAAALEAAAPHLVWEAAAAERERRICDLLHDHVVMIIHGHLPDGEPIYASGPIAFPDVLAESAVATRQAELDAERAAARERIIALSQQVQATYWVGPDDSPAPRRPFALLLRQEATMPP